VAEGVAQDRVLAYQRAVSQTPRHLGTSDCLPACLALATGAAEKALLPTRGHVLEDTGTTSRGPQRKPRCPRVGSSENPAAHAPAPRGFGAVSPPNPRCFWGFIFGGLMCSWVLADSPRLLVF